MITKINIKGVACYKEMATLETDKNVNLIYGLNGSGKSTLSEYLRKNTDAKYHECSIEPAINDAEEEIMVYNEHYVEEVFYTNQKQPGIFSLSKENKEAKRKIDEANEQLKKIRTQLQKVQNDWPTTLQAWNKEYQTYVDRIWEVQRTYTGGDRVLDYCLEGYKRSKEVLFAFVASLPKPTEEPSYTIDSLKEQVQQLKSASATQIVELQGVMDSIADIEKNPIFQQIITGNSDSYVADLINKLGNSDWVKMGLEYETEGICPFCQRKYDDGSHIIEDLRAFFDKAYEEAISALKELRNSYVDYKSSLSVNSAFDTIEIIRPLSATYNQAYLAYHAVLDENIRRIEEKLKNPSREILLQSSAETLTRLNEVITNANKAIREFNEKIQCKEEELGKIKNNFWSLIRYQYDQTISDYNNGLGAFTRKKTAYDTAVTQFNTQIDQQNNIIKEQQTKIVNIEDSIKHINNLLLDMGIADISIEKVEDEEMYAIARGEDKQVSFKTLSEGERTMISVLYFIETCQGLLDKDTAQKRRIIVLDDPVSSLSTQYLFAIGRIIGNAFYPDVKKNNSATLYEVKPKVEQLFILTHSLYFLYEMTMPKKEHREVSQKLFRVHKTSNGTMIDSMGYEHIQSDYHSYWLAVKDNTNPVLWANCMRNIIEYFFNFVEKRDLNNVMKALTDPKYQAFNRFINRESHSLGQNIYDFKDFDYDIFFEAFKLVFTSNNYEEHFNKMMSL